MLKTIQITIDESLLRRVDEAVEALDTNRSALFRHRMEEELRRQEILDSSGGMQKVTPSIRSNRASSMYGTQSKPGVMSGMTKPGATNEARRGPVVQICASR